MTDYKYTTTNLNSEIPAISLIGFLILNKQLVEPHLEIRKIIHRNIHRNSRGSQLLWKEF